MARKTKSRAPRDGLDVELHLPRSWRTITARPLRARGRDSRDAPVREVPEIRLSGAWLARIGFVARLRYLISVDRGIESIYLQADAVRTRKR